MDGTADLAYNNFSPSGKLMAYTISINGSDTTNLYVRRTDSPHLKSADQGGIRGEDPGRLPDVIRFVKFGGATWLTDDTGP